MHPIVYLSYHALAKDAIRLGRKHKELIEDHHGNVTRYPKSPESARYTS